VQYSGNSFWKWREAEKTSCLKSVEAREIVRVLEEVRRATSAFSRDIIDAASAKIFAKVAAETSANSGHYTRWHDSQCMFLYAMETGFANI
jgi:hypothetical protein